VTKIESDLAHAGCKCSDAGLERCTSQFSVRAILDLRLKRKAAGYSGEKLFRQQELRAAIERREATKSKALTFLIEGKVLCLQGYMIICCIPKASCEICEHSIIFLTCLAVYRTISHLSGRGANPVGRPRINSSTPINSRLAEWCYSWIEHEWVAINAEDCPTGRQYKKVVSLFSTDAVYAQYVKAFSFTAECSSGQTALSRRRFKVILDYHFKINSIAVRKKKNVSGKCEGESNFEAP
jgi:hypothetical protein